VPIPRKAATTRSALIAAAVACLADGGYRGTTTTAVCERAGVTSGALFGQFHNKGALLAAAEDELIARSLDEITDALHSIPVAIGGWHSARVERVIDIRASRPTGPGPHAEESEAAVRAIVDRLVAVYALPLPAALDELWIAARNDARLARALGAAHAATVALIEDTLSRVVPEMAGGSSLRAVALLVHATAWSKAAWTTAAGAALPDGEAGAAASPDAAERDFDYAIAILASHSRDATAPSTRAATPAARMLVRTLLARADTTARRPLISSP